MAVHYHFETYKIHLNDLESFKMVVLFLFSFITCLDGCVFFFIIFFSIYEIIAGREEVEFSKQTYFPSEWYFVLSMNNPAVTLYLQKGIL